MRSASAVPFFFVISIFFKLFSYICTLSGKATRKSASARITKSNNHTIIRLMNRLFYLIIVVLLAISCESDNCPAPDQEANEIECTFTVSIPEIKTRAADPSGSGQYANKLSYSFYTHDGEKILNGTVNGQIVDGVQQFTISRKLVEGRQYFLYLFARNEDAPYKQYLTYGEQYGGSTKFEVQNSNPNFCFANQDSYDIFAMWRRLPQVLTRVLFCFIAPRHNSTL